MTTPSKKPRILIIDDEEDFVAEMVMRLESEGCRVRAALDAAAGLKKVKTFHPDLVFLDVLMPDANGWEICRKLRNDSETKQILIVMTTGLPPSEVQPSIENFGANFLLKKPFEEKELKNLLARILPR